MGFVYLKREIADIKQELLEEEIWGNFRDEESYVKYKELQVELFEAITDGIDLNRLEEICNAEREERCMITPYKQLQGLYWIDEHENPPKIYPMAFLCMCRTIFVGVADTEVKEIVFTNKVYETIESAEQGLEELIKE